MQFTDVYYKKYNLSILSTESISTEFESIKVDESNYAKVFDKVKASFVSTMHPSGNIIILPYIFLHKITNEEFLNRVYQVVQNTSGLKPNVKNFILKIIKSGDVAYIDSKSFVPAVPLLYVHEKPMLILNGISKAFVYFLDEKLEVYDNTKVIKLFNIAYLMQSKYVLNFEKYLISSIQVFDALFELFKYLFLYKFGVTDNKYNSNKQAIDPILINFIYNAQYIPTYYRSVKTQLSKLQNYDYEYKQLTIIPTLANLIKQLQNANTPINVVSALTSLQKINFYMPILLANLFGLYVLYLFSYMHVLDLSFPRLLQIAPLQYFKQIIAEVQ